MYDGRIIPPIQGSFFLITMFPTTAITSLLGIEKPIISGGMVWCSGHELASAVSNMGGLGIVGAGSMHPDVFRTHVQKTKAATDKPFGVNVPLIYPQVEELMDIIIEEKVPVVITSAGNPKTWTPKLKEAGIKVMHVVSGSKFAQKAAQAGVDAVIAEGFEAGGHNGREETSTMVLLQSVVKAVDIPVVIAGGIGSGAAILGALSMGADAVQIGTLFALSQESSAHVTFKEACVKSIEGDTMLVLKKLIPTRLLANEFRDRVMAAEAEGASKDQLQEMLGKGRAKKAIFEGDLAEGEIEIGQICGIVDEIKSVAQIFGDLEKDFDAALARLQSIVANKK